MAAIWGAVIAAGIAAASKRAADSRAAKAAGASRAEQQALLEDVESGDYRGFGSADIFGTKPRAAEFRSEAYRPIDYGEVQLDTLRDNLGALPAIEDLTRGLNESLRRDSTMRIEQWAPGFSRNTRMMTDAAQALVGGQLPYSDVLDIVADRQSLGGALGTPGTFGAATLRDLGMSRLDAMKTGSEMMARIGNLVEQIDPIGQRSRAVDFTLAPGQTVPLKQTDAQFGATYGQMERILQQQSEQNKFMMEAAPDPAARNLFGAEWLAMTGNSAAGNLLGTGGAGTDWGSVLNTAMQAYSTYRNQTGGTNAGWGGWQGAAGGAQRYSPDSGAYNTWGPTSPGSGQNAWMETRRADQPNAAGYYFGANA